MKPLINSVFLSLLFICSANAAFSQAIPAETAKKIDSLFKQWDNKNSPGCAIGIIRNDSLIYAKGYGMANLEYGIPITTQTVFEMGSVSKQFTAYAIVLLAQQRKLGLDDDIRKYLAWFPDLGKKITIRHLLTHTSGIRDYQQLLAIAGTRPDDVIKQDQIIRVLSRQRTLNFSPGEQEMYSNSGYVMLAEIVQSVTGKSLRLFTDSTIFKPLGMNSTHFLDYTEIVPNRASSYLPKGKDGYTNCALSDCNMGATNLFTNIGDMSKWIMNFYDAKIGGQAGIDMMTRPAKLKNGKEVPSGFGLMSGDYHGQKRYFHGGHEAGYNTFMMVYPDVKTGFIMFGNQGDGSVVAINDLSEMFIKTSATASAEIKVPQKNEGDTIISNTAGVKPFVGSYIAEDGTRFSFKLEHQKLYLEAYGSSFLLVKTNKDTFRWGNNGISFAFRRKDAKNISVQQIYADSKRIFNKYDSDTKPSKKQLLAYTGTYFCPELDCRYNIILKNDRLVLNSVKYGDTPLILYGNRQLTDDFDWMNNLIIVRNKKGKITGFEVNCDKVQDLWFKKVE